MDGNRLRVALAVLQTAVFTAAVCAAASAVAARDSELFSAARYRILGAGEGSAAAVEEVTVALLDRAAINGATYHWWQMDLRFRTGETLAIRGLSQRAPMTSPDGCGDFARYLFRQRDGQVIEYRTEDGRALLPRYSFRDGFLPAPAWEAPYVDGFAAAGTCLGHMAVLVETTGVEVSGKWDNAIVLRLRPDLLIGTGRSVRDDGVMVPRGEDYTYVPYEKQDYDDMLKAGINYVGVQTAKPNQRPWAENREFFFRCAPVFPDDFYRSNYYGMNMFSDEPMVRMGWQEIAPDQMFHPHQVTSMLMTRVGETYVETGIPGQLEQVLRRQGVNLGVMRIRQDGVPTWETVYESAFYELAGGAPGIVHEGRYVEDGYGWHPGNTFGVEADGTNVDLSPAELLANYYAYLRGAARAFDGQWGMAIYGHSDPALRELAMQLAYDMGARHIWFWTSDHEHHVPWHEQLALSKSLMRYIQRHPRGDLESLRRGADLAIVYPMGYSLSWGALWGARSFAHDRTNGSGTLYRDVVSAAMWEGVLAAKRGESFDFTVDHPGLADLGYARTLRVTETGAVIEQPLRIRRDGRVPTLKIALGPAEPVPVVEDATTVYTALVCTGRAIAIDGRLDEWGGASWIPLPAPAVADATWDGPEDCSGRVAFGFDGENLFVAADLLDDVFAQPYQGWGTWQGDSLQLGLDPLCSRDDGDYTQDQHELGLLVVGMSRAIAWRWQGRVGQSQEEILSARVRAARQIGGSRMIYEAAIPLAELAPLAPEIRRSAGASLVLNDHDGAGREAYLETSPGAMTAGKHPSRFETLHFPETPASAREQVAAPRSWATLVWNNTVTRRTGPVRLTLATAAWEAQQGALEATLVPLAPLQAPAAAARIAVPLSSEPSEQPVELTLDAEPGRYRLEVRVLDEAGRAMVQEARTIFVY